LKKHLQKFSNIPGSVFSRTQKDRTERGIAASGTV